MGDMADWDLDQLAFPDDEGWDENEDESEDEEATTVTADETPEPPPATPLKLDIATIRAVLGAGPGLMEALAMIDDDVYGDDFDWDDAMHFLIPSLLEWQREDIIRIVWDRAIRRTPDDPFQMLQKIMDDLDLTVAMKP